MAALGPRCTGTMAELQGQEKGDMEQGHGPHGSLQTLCHAGCGSQAQQKGGRMLLPVPRTRWGAGTAELWR